MQGPDTSGMDKAMVVKGKKQFKKIARKKPSIAFRRVLMKALKCGLLSQMCAMMEPMVRKVVGEVLENTLSRFLTLPRQLQCPDSRIFRLHFKSKLARSIFTLSEVKDYQGLPVRIELQDQATGEVVTTAQESAAKLEVVPLEGDFDNDDNEDWCQEDFDKNVVKERVGKGPILSGNLTIVLKEGVGTLDDVTFTDNSSWTKSKTFRLGVRLAAKSSEVLSIREGRSGKFQVKERRGAYYEKHYPPAPNDDVWRLEKITKGGKCHEKLNNHGIHTVEQFHTYLISDPEKLRNILGPRLAGKMWQDIVAHVQTCNFSDERAEHMSFELLTDNSKMYEEQLVDEIYETSSKIDAGKMLNSENLDEVRGVGGRGNENEDAVQFGNGIPAISRSYAVQDQQSAQYVPIIFQELQSSEALIHAPTNVGFGVNTSMSPPLLPQTSLGVSDASLDDIFAIIKEQDENEYNQEQPGASNFLGQAVSVTFGGVSVASSSEKWLKLRAVFLCVFFIRKMQGGQKSTRN